jgi:hypothetical protein
MSRMSPILFATTEMVKVVPNGVAGFLEIDVQKLAAQMRRLLNDLGEARTLGVGARRVARARRRVLNANGLRCSAKPAA